MLQAFTDKLRQVLGRDALLERHAECIPYECDGLTAFRQVPPLVALPGNREQVQTIMRLCAKYAVPLVSRGAGTSLSGGATPHPQGLLMSLNRMNRLIKIDRPNMRVLVEPGIANLEVSRQVEHLGLFYAPDPSSQIVSSIGGNIAENAGGVHCIKYGLTAHNLLGVELVLADGELVELGLDDGLDLLGVITGSEGMLGVVTAAWLQLRRLPERVAMLMAGFPRVSAAAEAVTNTIASGVTPAGLEMMDKPIIHLVENFVAAGYPLDCEAMLLCELDSNHADLDAQLATVKDIFTRAGATSLKTSEDPHTRAKMWLGRKSAFPAVGHHSPSFYCIDGTVPRRELGNILKTISGLASEHAMQVLNVFHAGDGNLHPLILYDARQPEQLQSAMRLGDAILTACVDLGGTVTGEHGVGLEKLNAMCYQFPAPELEQFHRLRSAFDPQGLLNPGKAIPTLARCAELGGMHVHQGHIPFPHLDRL